MKQKKSKKKTDSKNEERGLFDHINHIRRDKSSNYISTLSDEERKSFNHYMIVRCLSMDKSCIEEVALLSKYFDKMDDESFYKVCVEITPSTMAFFPYIKSKNKKYNKQILEYVKNKYLVSLSDANDYCKILMATDDGKEELKSICRGYGLSDKEIKALFGKKDEI